MGSEMCIRDRYMSVHVVLTGVRGILAPYLGVTLYEVLRPEGLEAWVFGVAALITGIGSFGFVILRRRERLSGAPPSDQSPMKE